MQETSISFGAHYFLKLEGGPVQPRTLFQRPWLAFVSASFQTETDRGNTVPSKSKNRYCVEVVGPTIDHQSVLFLGSLSGFHCATGG
ncbi:hypothetical protein TNIN_381841 [Trichonephila inaurata madagascariensis]|uniref:Uncharacterized protein n=1 Tax=Trichonephila inaurata madagascariensis TaxID=2747483 RepID=A0A8X7CPA4_9ARAC|nr:hypothetical protein TNIN_381841 [Trichonephila inaurata madagascariensis]